MNPTVQLVFGGAYFMTGDEDRAHEILETLSKHDIKTIDTALVYGESEAMLGKINAGKRFNIDTKTPGGLLHEGNATEQNVMKDGLESLERLGIDKVDVFYIHGPDAATPLESTLAGINMLHKRGAFSRFGLSNYTPEDVRKVHDLCTANGYVLPSVYQGNYNAMARHLESTLFPLLHELGIAFYAYSPIAGGFLAKTKQQVLDGHGRFKPDTFDGKMYGGLYAKPTMLDALEEWGRIAEEAGCEAPAELAYRWVRSNSALNGGKGDAVIIGGRNVAQVEQTIRWMEKGPLSEKTVKAVDGIWKKVKHEAPTHNTEMVGKM